MKKKLEYVSNIKAIAILMVVFVHSASPLFYQLGQVDMRRWYITTIYDAFVRCCVPLFLIVNGATVLNKDYETKDWFVNKIFKRLFLPFLFYFLIVILVNKKSIFSIFTLVDIGYWFHFFGIILTLYLLYPIIRIWLKNTNIRWVYYFLALWFVSMMLNFWFPKFTLFSTNFVYGYVGFPIIGYLISNMDTKKFKYWGLLAYIVSGLLIFGLTALLCLKIHSYNEKYFDYLSPLVILMSVGLFVFVKNIKFVFKNKIFVFIRDFLSDHSYGIYFLHPLILTKFYILTNFIHPVFSDWMIFGAGVTITSLIVYILSKIPFIKDFAG
jgi:surface polysaccharide O-acyltransferase-like enzyme